MGGGLEAGSMAGRWEGDWRQGIWLVDGRGVGSRV